MKEHFQQRVDDTTIALEAGKSRNPLYHAHKDILGMINEIQENEKFQEKNKQEKSELAILKEKYSLLKEENRKLLNVNATLLFKSRSKL